MIEIGQYQESIRAICKKLGVQRLDIFGSANGPGFGPDSDIDVVALFDREQGHMFSRYFDLKERLERIFHRSVDVVLEDSIGNPYFREAIQHNRICVYES